MKTQKQDSKMLLQQNTHLKEWKGTLAFEIKTRYDLDGKHKQERSRLALEGATSEERILLSAKHSQEKHQLNQFHNHSRKILEQRHAWEKILLRQQHGM